MKNLRTRSTGIVHEMTERGGWVGWRLCSSFGLLMLEEAIETDEKVNCKKCLKRRQRLAEGK